jgi:cobalt-zinc-cadmium resistance protein CzcA
LSGLISEQLKYKALLDNYNTTGKPLYDEIMRTALKYYNLGEIDFYQFVNSYESAIQIQLEYFENLYRYNLSASAILHFSK